jgi:peptidoglycan/LPS O-acetylase OafA/YrhL
VTRLEKLLSPFKRETSGGGFIAEVDGLRFFAIASVLMLHLDESLTAKHPPAGSPLHAVASTGFVGVQLFFIISGFVLGLPFAKAAFARTSVPLKPYFLRRLTRLEPPYIICMCAMAAITSVNHTVDPAHFFASLFYVHNIAFHSPSSLNVVAWSLEVEVQFYVLAPLLAYLFRIGAPGLRRGVLCALIVGLSAAQFLQSADIGHGLSLANQLQYFLCGFLLVDLRLNVWTKPSARPWAWDLAAALSAPAVIAMLIGGPWPELFIPWLLFVPFAAAFRGTLWPKLLQSPLVFTIGGMCYTIYLYHYTLIFLVGKVFARVLPASMPYAGAMAFGAVFIVPPVLVVTALMFRLLEKPFMRRDWPQALMRRLGVARA